jgi:hypothetical protein
MYDIAASREKEVIKYLLSTFIYEVNKNLYLHCLMVMLNKGE